MKSIDGMLGLQKSIMNSHQTHLIIGGGMMQWVKLLLPISWHPTSDPAPHECT